MGGGGSTRTETKIIQPTPPPQPSTAEAIKEYVDSLPAIFQAQLDFAPKEAAQQAALAQQYSLPLAQIYQDAQSALFPETSAIQEQLAAEARAGMVGGAPQSVRDRFQDDFRANIGTNVGSPIGGVETAKALAGLDEDFRSYYRNLALSVAGRQPLSQPLQPQTTSQLGQYSPRDALGFTSQNYGTFAQASRPIVAQNSFGKTNPNYMQAIGSGIGAFAAFSPFGAPAAATGAIASTKLMKKNIKPVSDSLEKVKKLQGVLYDWKGTEQADGGVIAERVEEVMPEATTEIDGVKAIKPMVIIAHLIEAVKELSEVKHAT